MVHSVYIAYLTNKQPKSHIKSMKFLSTKRMRNIRRDRNEISNKTKNNNNIYKRIRRHRKYFIFPWKSPISFDCKKKDGKISREFVHLNKTNSIEFCSFFLSRPFF